MKKSKDFPKKVFKRERKQKSGKLMFKTIPGATVSLEKDGCFYSVIVSGDVVYKTANELFAVQRFNEI